MSRDTRRRLISAGALQGNEVSRLQHRLFRCLQQARQVFVLYLVPLVSALTPHHLSIFPPLPLAGFSSPPSLRISASRVAWLVQPAPEIAVAMYAALFVSYLLVVLQRDRFVGSSPVPVAALQARCADENDESCYNPPPPPDTQYSSSKIVQRNGISLGLFPSEPFFCLFSFPSLMPTRVTCQIPMKPYASSKES